MHLARPGKECREGLEILGNDDTKQKLQISLEVQENGKAYDLGGN